MIRVTDDYCPAPAIENTSQVISITVYPPCDIKSNASSINADCSSNNGSISISPSGGYGPYTSYYFDLNGAPVNPDSLFAGTYLVNIVDSTLCEVTDTVVVDENNLSISSSFNNPLCYGDSTASASITVLGGYAPYTYTWFPSNIDSSFISNLTAGLYSVQVTDANNCTVSDTFLINQPLPITIDDSLVNVSCFGNSNGLISVSVNGGVFPYSYYWNTGDSTSNIINISYGSYQLTVTDSNNCITVETITVNQPNDLFAYFNLNYVSCFGLSDGNIDATVTGGTPPFSFLWSTADTTEDLFNIPSDMYILSLLDSNNCFFTDTIVVFEPDQIVASLTINSGNLESLGSGGTMPYTYEIYDPSGNLFASTSNNMGVSFSINPVVLGTYTLVVTDANGCIDSSQANVLPSTITEIQTINDLKIYPNPSNDIFNINFSSMKKQNFDISIYNILGERIFNEYHSNLIGEFKCSFNLYNFERSVYFLEISSNQIIINKKLILK